MSLRQLSALEAALTGTTDVATLKTTVGDAKKNQQAEVLNVATITAMQNENNQFKQSNNNHNCCIKQTVRTWQIRWRKRNEEEEEAAAT